MNKIILGTLNAIDGYQISIRAIDVESGAIDATFSTKAHTKKEIDGAMGQLARKIYDHYYEESPSAWGYYLRSIIPGWSQVYAGHEVKGYTLMGAFVFSGVCMGYALYDFQQKRDEYENLEKGTPQSTFDEKYNAAEDTRKTAQIAIGVFCSVFAVHLVDMLLLSRPSVMFGKKEHWQQSKSDIVISFDAHYDSEPGLHEQRYVFGINKNF